MNKKTRRFLSMLLCMSMAMPASLPAFAAEVPADVQQEAAMVQDLDAYLLENTTLNNTSRALPVDRSEVNEHALNGYFTYTFTTKEAVNGRSFDMYFGKHAALRAYIHVIAVDASVEDVPAFLAAEGWLDQADANGELLFILKAGENGWGTPEEEAAYLEACLAENIGNTANGTRSTFGGGIVTSGSIPVSDGSSCSVFTGHACNYYVGYGDAAAVLESWTSNNPSYVISQAFLGGESVGEEYLAQVAQRTYNGINTGSYYYGFDDETFQATLDEVVAAGDAKNADFVTNADIVVPTLFQGYAEDDASVVYWKSVNDVVTETVEPGVYRQSIDSDAWQTLYANKNAAKWEEGTAYGISQVQVKQDAMNAEQIRDFLATYTRYTTPLVYSNNIAYRMDYYPVTEAARTAAESGQAIAIGKYSDYNGDQVSVELRALESGRVSVPGCPVEGTVYSYISAFNDYDADGILDPREAVVYVPDSAKNYGEEGAPVVVIFPGSTQAASTFMDCSGWWAVANDEGCVLVIVGQFCSNNAARLAYGGTADNANFVRSALVMMKDVVSKDAGVALDYTRIYASGHSAGCNAIQTLCHTTEDYYFAGVAATSFPDTTFTAESMPSYLFAGQADISEPLPDTRSRDLVKDPWNKAKDSAIYTWLKGVTRINGLAFNFKDGDKEGFLANCSNYNESGRYFTYSFANEQGIDLARFTRTMAREHNCYPEEFRLAWDFLKNFSLKDGVRYYSESAYTAEDAIALELENEAVSFDDYDVASITVSEEPNRLPLNGYFSKKIAYTVDGVEKEGSAKIYIGENAPMASYFTVIGVPAGTNTYEFLEKSGWLTYADKMEEGLFVIEAAEDAAENQALVDAAMKWLIAPNVNGTAVFSNYGIFYITGYGQIGSALENWAAKNTMRTIAQAYVDSEGLDAATLAEIGATPCIEAGRTSLEILDDQKMTYSEITVPTLYAVKDAAAVQDSLNYWLNANDVAAEPVVDGTTVTYYQKQDSKRWMTLYWNDIFAADPETYGPYGLSQVIVENSGAAYTTYTDQITKFFRQYMSYGNTTEYNKQLSVRADFDALGVKVKTVNIDAVKGHSKREYMVYAPAGCENAYGEAGAPLVVVNAGAGTTDKNFFNGSQWWQVAKENNFVLVFMCEDNNTPTTLTYHDTDIFLDAVLEEVERDYKIDDSRIYLSGHSAGSGTTQAIGALYPERFAAIATTSAIPDMADTAASFEGMFGGAGRHYGDKAYAEIPNMFMYGEGDRPELHDGIWYSNHTDSEYYAEADLTKCTEALVKYHLGVWDLPMGQEGTETCAEYTYASNVAENPEHGYESWIWSVTTGEGVAVPVMQVNRVQNIGHTNNNAEFPLLWDYVKHFCTIDGVRYYSASAFAEDDAVVIKKAAPVVQQQKQKITVTKTTVNKVYGDKAFNLGAKTTGDGKLTYTSSNKKVVTVNAKGKVSIKGVGTAVITIKAAETENFKAATKKVTIKVAPKKGTVSKVKADKKNVTVTVKKDSQVTGYEIQISTGKKFTKKTTTTKTTKKTALTMKVKKAGTYYVRTRSYKTVSGKKMYGAYSAVKSVKVK